MTIDPERQRKASSGPRGLSFQQKMEEARARRAEVLATKPPANDDTGVSKPAKRSSPKGRAGADPKLVSKPVVPAEVHPVHADADPRFPEIIMPEELAQEEAEAAAQKPSKRKGFLVAAILLLLGLIFGAFYLSPQNATPLATQSVTSPDVPEPSSDAAFASPDRMPLVRQAPITLAETASEAPVAAAITASAPKPSVAIPSLMLLPNTTIDPVPVAPTAVTLWQAAVSPLGPLTPESDPLFALPEVVELTVSLIIPNRASQAKVRAVTDALDATGFVINDPRLVSYVIKTTQVRYFHDSDAEAASALAKEIDGIARDFTDYSPSPPQGLVEVFVEGTSPAQPVQEARPETRGLAGDLRQFGSDIRNALRSITR